MVAVWVRWLGVGAGSLVSTSCRTRLSHIRLDHVRILIEGKISESQSWEELPESAIAYKGHTDQRPREESDLEAAQAVAAVLYCLGQRSLSARWPWPTGILPSHPGLCLVLEDHRSSPAEGQFRPALWQAGRLGTGTTAVMAR